MKAKMMEDVVCDGAMGFVHSMFYPINRIIVDGLVVTLHNKELYVVREEDFKKSEDFKFIKEIEVPEALVDEIRAYLVAKEKISSKIEDVRQLFS